MNERIHFNDNLYYIRMKIQQLQKLQTLNVDANLFSKEQITELQFLDKVISEIYETLLHMPHIREKDKYMHAVLRIKRSLVSLLTSQLNEAREINYEIVNFYYNDWEQLINKNTNDIQNILEELQSDTEAELDSSQMLSEMEIQLLLDENNSE